jgi:hypothetical protein
VLAEAGWSAAEIDTLLAERAVEMGRPFDRAAPASAPPAPEGGTTR